MKGRDQLNNGVVIEELNTLLRGTYMGIRSLEHYIQKVEDEGLKHTFQSMQQETKENAQKLAERIQNLGGVPADDEGFSGSMHSFMHKMMLSDNEEAILEDALKGFDKYGVEYSEELVKGDLDPESRRLAEEVIDTSRKHAEQIRLMLY
ncbi:PA2169 family four-helix-bundle protein [Fredinandcohnia sp. 179-A 10B2 NHS]|uniref:PA2169 family four-helix-bundle protein n=1 Tax=Fredinandcohnia sp. 179-A 10B2 NHS TaxID=3235176 RepID=UPI0039A1629E